MFSFKKKDPVKKSYIELDEIDKLKERIESKDTQIWCLERDIKDMEALYNRELADKNSRYSRDTETNRSIHDNEIRNKNAEVKSLENKIARIESEMEARLALQEDIHADEILALEEKYKAMEVNLEEKYKAKDDALDTMQEMDKKHMNARAEEVLAEAKSNATEIIKSAYEEAFKIKQKAIDSYQDIIDILSKGIDDKNDIKQLVDLVKASTENYPAFPTKVSSTSSSK